MPCGKQTGFALPIFFTASTNCTVHMYCKCAGTLSMCKTLLDSYPALKTVARRPSLTLQYPSFIFKCMRQALPIVRGTYLGSYRGKKWRMCEVVARLAVLVVLLGLRSAPADHIHPERGQLAHRVKRSLEQLLDTENQVSLRRYSPKLYLTVH